MTWNATGIMSSSSCLSDCLSFKNIDICGLSEHWLYEKDCWERADLLALVCGVFCEFVTFPLVSWVRCGT